MEPAAGERLGSGLLLLEVAAHHGRPAVDDLAHLALRHVVAVRVHHARLDVDRRAADRAHLAHRVLALEEGGVGGHLGLAERVHDLHRGERAREQLERRQRARSTHPTSPPAAADVSSWATSGREQISCHWVGTKKHIVTAWRPSSSTECGGIEPGRRRHHGGGAELEERQHPVQATDVEQRQPGEPDVAGARSHLVDPVHRVDHEVLVGEHRPLRPAGGAGGVHQEGQLVVVHQHAGVAPPARPPARPRRRACRPSAGTPDPCRRRARPALGRSRSRRCASPPARTRAPPARAGSSPAPRRRRASGSRGTSRRTRCRLYIRSAT